MGVAQVSNKMRFRSTTGVVSVPKRNKKGYRPVAVDNKDYLFHRLVGFAFLVRVPGKTTINHIDGVPGNDWPSNLEWADPSDQVRHSYATNQNRKSSAPRQSKPVMGRKVGTDDEWTRYESTRDAARELKLYSGSISQCCKETREQTGGYEFKYEDPVDLEGEEWRTVKGTKAAVSSLGRFRNSYGVVTTPAPELDGYVRVTINKKHHPIHNLIAVAFELPKLEGQTTVNHKDRNPSNNRLDNLEWASPSEQVLHSYATNPDRESSAPRQSRKVFGRKVGTDDEWTMYDSTRDAARKLELHPGSISACCNKENIKQAGGYEFYYEDQMDLDGEEWRDVVLE